MRVADHYLGTWLCQIIGLALRLCGKRLRRVDHPTPPEPESVREILVMKLLGMGSILQATSLFRALRLRYPSARITLLTFYSNRGLADFELGVDTVVTVNTSGFWRFVASTVVAIRQLRRLRFDLLLGLEFYSTYATLMTFLVRKRFAMGFGGFAHYRRNFYHDFVSSDSARHVQDKFCSFARRLRDTSAMPPLARLHVNDPAAVVAGIATRLEFTFDPDEYLILVNINTGEMAPRR